MMDPGKLKHRLLLQDPDETSGEAGDLPGTYITVAAVRAAILTPSGIEQATAAGDASIGRCSVRIRRRTGVSAKQRLWDPLLGVAYNILSVPPVSPDPLYMDLPCEVVNVVS